MSKAISRKILGWLLFILTMQGLIYGFWEMKGLYIVSWIILFLLMGIAILCWAGLIFWLMGSESE